MREAARELKVGTSTAKRAFDALQSDGFIVAEQRGHFSWKINPNGSKFRPASEWRLTIYDDTTSTLERVHALATNSERGAATGTHGVYSGTTSYS